VGIVTGIVKVIQNGTKLTPKVTQKAPKKTKKSKMKAKMVVVVASSFVAVAVKTVITKLIGLMGMEKIKIIIMISKLAQQQNIDVFTQNVM